jgi:MFS family permease
VLSSYRGLFAQPGTFAFVAAGLIGRFPISMLGLGAVVMVTGSGGSYALAGAVSAVLALAEAAAAPVIGRASDRAGQSRLLTPTAIVHLVGIVGLVVVAVSGAPGWVYLPAAAVAGTSVPQVSAMVRTRWADRLGAGPALSTAFSLESSLDEVVFVVGPVLATVLGTVIWAPAGVATAGVLAAAGALLLAARHDSEPAREAGDESTRAASAIAVAGLRVLMVSALGFGVVFGAVDVAMIAFTQEHGHRSLSGVLLALMAVGSLVSGLLYGTRQWVSSLRSRFIVATSVFVLAYVGVAGVTSVPVMAGVIIVAGITIAPTAIAETSLVEKLVPAAARTEGFSWMNTAVAAGVALGSALAGVVVSHTSGHRAFLVAVAAAAFALLTIVLGARTLVPPAADPEPQPSSP